MNYEDSTTESLRVFLENMVGEALLAQRIGLEVSPAAVVSASLEQIL